MNFLNRKIAQSFVLLLLFNYTTVIGQERSYTEKEIFDLLEKSRSDLELNYIKQGIADGLIGLEQAKIKNLKEIQVDFKDILGNLYFADKDYQRAIYYFMSIIDNATSNEIAITANAHFSLGNVFTNMQAYSKGAEHYILANSSFEKVGYIQGIVETTQALAFNYILSGQNEKSNSVLQQLLSLARNNNLKSFESFALQQLTVLHSNAKNPLEASKYAKDYYDLTKTPNAAYQLSVEYRETLDYRRAGWFAKIAYDSDPSNINYIENVGLIALGDNKFNDALESFNKALSIGRRNDNNRVIVRQHNNLAMLYSIQSNERLTLENLNKAEELGKIFNFKELLVDTYNQYIALYRASDSQLSNYYQDLKNDLENELKYLSAPDPDKFKSAEILANNMEQQVKIQMATELNQKMEVQELRKETEKQQLSIEEQRKLLLDREKKTKELEADRNLQNLTIAEQQFNAELRELELLRLKQEGELSEQAAKENAIALDLIEKERLILQQQNELQANQISAAEQVKKLYAAIIFAVVLVLILLAVIIIRTNRTRKLIAKQNDNLKLQQEKLKKSQIQLSKSLRDEKTVRVNLETTNTELKATQSQLIHAEKMSSLGQLTAGIAHEINNPISFVKGGIQTLEMTIQEIMSILDQFNNLKTEDSVKLKVEMERLKELLGPDIEDVNEIVPQLMKDIAFGADRVETIVKSLRIFSRHDEAHVKKINIHENLDAAILLLNSKIKQKAELVTKYNKNLDEIECIPGHLNQVFVNIINNAVDAIEGEGVITIQTQDLGHEIAISIQDNGTGISEENLKNIFNPFFTTKKVGDGTGLGLSISYSIIKEHKGRIKAESKPGKGSRFTIYLNKTMEDYTNDQALQPKSLNTMAT